MQYPTTLRDALVRRMLSPGGPTPYALSKESGISKHTLSRWCAAARSVARMSRHDTPTHQQPRRPGDRTALEKLRAVLEASVLDDAELGAFLRREGLHEAQLAEWTELALGALSGPSPARRRAAKDTQRIRRLEREVQRKDRALAEATALLVLRGKLQALLAEEGDDTTQR